MSELPLFPLSGVLFPFGRVPLKIFEPRYLDLVRDCMKSSSPFGVVWIRRGAEVVQRGRAAPELGDYGTCAHIVDWDQLPNGLLGITIEGAQRFELMETHTRASLLPSTSIALAACNTAKRMALISMRAREITSRFLPSFAIGLPKATREPARFTISSSAFSALPMDRMQ